MIKMSRNQLNKRYGKAFIDAIDYIGLHRKTRVYPHKKGCPVSVRTANKLIKYGYAMEYWQNKNGKSAIMLTYQGERIFTMLHPSSKYAIK